MPLPLMVRARTLNPSIQVRALGGHPKIRYIVDNALIAQLVEHITCNDGVRRSSRRGGTRIKRAWYNGITLAFQADDTGSIPVARSMRMWRNGRRPGFRYQCRKTWGFESLHPYQVYKSVRENGNPQVSKTLRSRFNSYHLRQNMWFVCIEKR